MKPIILLLAAFQPAETGLLVDRCDLIERQHYHCPDDGHLIFTQYIFWDWSPVTSRHHVIAWRLDKKQFTRSGNTITGMDGDTLRRIEGEHYRERWEMHDAEIEDQHRYPKEWRRGLSK
jgi:hypothetical protein